MPAGVASARFSGPASSHSSFTPRPVARKARRFQRRIPRSLARFSWPKTEGTLPHPPLRRVGPTLIHAFGVSPCGQQLASRIPHSRRAASCRRSPRPRCGRNRRGGCAIANWLSIAPTAPRCSGPWRTRRGRFGCAPRTSRIRRAASAPDWSRFCSSGWTTYRATPPVARPAAYRGMREPTHLWLSPGSGPISQAGGHRGSRGTTSGRCGCTPRVRPR